MDGFANRQTRVREEPERPTRRLALEAQAVAVDAVERLPVGVVVDHRIGGLYPWLPQRPPRAESARISGPSDW